MSLHSNELALHSISLHSDMRFRGRQTFSVKDYVLNIFSPPVSVVTTQPCHGNWKAAIHNT